MSLKNSSHWRSPSWSPSCCWSWTWMRADFIYVNVKLNTALTEAGEDFAQDVEMQTGCLWPAAAAGSTVSSSSFLSASGLISPLFCAARLLFSSHFILLLFLLLCWGGRPVGQVVKAKFKHFSASMLQANCLASRERCYPENKEGKQRIKCGEIELKFTTRTPSFYPKDKNEGVIWIEPIHSSAKPRATLATEQS